MADKPKRSHHNKIASIENAALDYAEWRDTFDFNPSKHEFSRDGVVIPSVTQVLARAGICDFSFVEEETRIHAMKRGTSVHWLLQLEDEGALNYRTVPRSLRGYRKAYRDWKRHSSFCPLWVECKFVSQYGYAGIIDRAGSFPATTMYLSGTNCVLDFKTGEIPDWVRLQLAAYALAIEPIIAVARNIRRIALTLSASGAYKIKEFPLCTFDSDIAKFMHALKGTQCQ
jgi:hypothetical protein